MCDSFVFFFNDRATTEIYTLSLHDALPILANETTTTPIRAKAKYPPSYGASSSDVRTSLAMKNSVPTKSRTSARRATSPSGYEDRKSTRLNSSHANISYAVFCLKKKKKTKL